MSNAISSAQIRALTILACLLQSGLICGFTSFTGRQPKVSLSLLSSRVLMARACLHFNQH